MDHDFFPALIFLFFHFEIAPRPGFRIEDDFIFYQLPGSFAHPVQGTVGEKEVKGVIL